MNLVIIGLSLVGFAFIGIGIGFSINKISNMIKDKKIKKDVIRVLKGEKENTMLLEDGTKQDVSKFIVKDKEDNLVLIDFKNLMKNGTPNN